MRCFGERCRVGGTVLWIGALQEYIIHEKDELSGFNIKRFKYQRDIAVGICHGPVGDGDPEHGALKGIYANGIPILVNPGDSCVTSSNFYVERRDFSQYPGFFIVDLVLGLFGVGIMRIHQIKEEAAANPDIDNVKDFTEGGYVTTLGQPGFHPGHHEIWPCWMPEAEFHPVTHLYHAHFQVWGE
ncbi:MAG: hypothetical protein IIC63_08495 [Proteobacteria bacterium]|nr:hypothetical protein [Pseudomonadota bacterium]